MQVLIFAHVVHGGLQVDLVRLHPGRLGLPRDTLHLSINKTRVTGVIRVVRDIGVIRDTGLLGLGILGY